MPGIARAGYDITDAPAKLVYAPSTSVTVNGHPIAVVGVAVECHNHGNQLVCSEVRIGSSNVFAGGKQVVRENDSALCGHKIIIASPNVKAN